MKISADELSKIKDANPNSQIEDKEAFKGAELQGLNGIHYREIYDRRDYC